MYRVKLEDFNQSIENQQSLMLIDGKAMHLNWSRLVWWPEQVRALMKKDSDSMGNRKFLFGEQNGHEKFRDKVLRLLVSHVIPNYPDVDKLHLSRFHSFRTTSYNLLSQSISESNKLSEKMINQYFGWESQGVQQKYTRSLQNKTLQRIADEIDSIYPWPNLNKQKDKKYVQSLHDNIKRYTENYMFGKNTQSL